MVNRFTDLFRLLIESGIRYNERISETFQEFVLPNNWAVLSGRRRRDSA